MFFIIKTILHEDPFFSNIFISIKPTANHLRQGDSFSSFPSETSYTNSEIPLSAESLLCLNEDKS